VRVDPVQAAHVLDELQRHYAEAWPPLTDRLQRLEEARQRTGPPPINLVEWTAHYLMAALRVDPTPSARRKMAAALTRAGAQAALSPIRLAKPSAANPDETPEVREEEEEPRAERVLKAERQIARQLEGQTPPERLNFEILGSEAVEELPPGALPRWERASQAVRRDLEPANVAALVAELGVSRSIVESLDIAAKRLKGLSWPARCVFLERVGFPFFAVEPRRMTALERLGWVERPLKGEVRRGHLDARRRRVLRAVEQIARATHYNSAQISLLLGLLTDRLAEARQAGVEGFCLLRPRCEACPARSACLYARLRPKEAPAAPARLPMKHWAPEDRPRDKARRLGVASLTNAELLALLLRTGAEDFSALDAAHSLLARFGSLQGIHEAELQEIIQAVPGVGEAKAIELKAAFETGIRLASAKLERGLIIANAEDVFRALRLRFRGAKQEVFQMLALTSKNEVIELIEITRGTLTGSPVHPREAFKHAIARSASGVIFVHNHPSGDPTPSDADHEITERLGQAAKVLGIRMLDHVILGKESFYSFAVGEIRTLPESEG
jgi:DNA repair protein RadC